MRLQKTLKAKDIADILDREILGDDQIEVSGVNEIHMVEAGDISFVDYEKYYKQSLESAASVVIINKKVEVPDGKALIISQDPVGDFNKLSEHFRPFVPVRKSQNSQEIGEGTVLQPGAFVAEKVKIGRNCIIHANVVIQDYTEIGDNVVIHPNTCIGVDAFYLRKVQTEESFRYDSLNSCGRVIIEDNVEIGAACTISRGVSGDTVIGQGSKLDSQVHVGHGTTIGKHCIIAAQAGISGKCKIGNYVTIWGQVGITKEVHIGDYAVVLAQSGVDKSIEGNTVYLGSPVEVARKKWKEMVISKKLPDIWNNLNNLLD